ncbi:MAG: histidinol-phosphate transaminase, partial [Shewanella sp.]
LNAQGERLAAALNLYCEQWGGAVLTPNGNYVLAEFDDVAKVAQLLIETGIVARAYKDPRLAKAIRFSFSSQADTDRLVSLFESQKL